MSQLRVQVWALPAVNLPAYNVDKPLLYGVPPTIRMREVEYRDSWVPHGRLLLFELLTQGDDFDEAWGPEGVEPPLGMERYFEPITSMIPMLSFGLLTKIRPFTARILVNPPPENKFGKCEAITFQGAPPGMPSNIFEFGIEDARVIPSGECLARGMKPEVAGAIDWLIAGRNAIQPAVSLLCYWLGIEMLSPLVEEPHICPNQKCKAPLLICPECKQLWLTKKATKSVTKYLRSEPFNYSAKDANRMYEARNEVAHGRIALDLRGIHKVRANADEAREVLLKGIKFELNWVVDRPQFAPRPEIPTLAFKGPVEVDSERFYDFPGSEDVWSGFEYLKNGFFHQGILALAGLDSEVGINPQCDDEESTRPASPLVKQRKARPRRGRGSQ